MVDNSISRHNILFFWSGPKIQGEHLRNVTKCRRDGISVLRIL